MNDNKTYQHIIQECLELKEKVFINRETGELYLWTNKANNKEYLFWFYVANENDCLVEGSCRLDYLGIL